MLSLERDQHHQSSSYCFLTIKHFWSILHILSLIYQQLHFWNTWIVVYFRLLDYGHSIMRRCTVDPLVLMPALNPFWRGGEVVNKITEVFNNLSIDTWLRGSFMLELSANMVAEYSVHALSMALCSAMFMLLCRVNCYCSYWNRKLLL